MTAPAATLPRASSGIWVCESNFIVCPNDHLLRFHETNYRGDLRRLTGPAFLTCKECSPATYFLALFTTTPSSMVTCYALARTSYETWDRNPDVEIPTTTELLYLLRSPDGGSYNPTWRPPQPRQGR